jgi:hypothetical protein
LYSYGAEVIAQIRHAKAQRVVAVWQFGTGNAVGGSVYKCLLSIFYTNIARDAPQLAPGRAAARPNLELV